MTFFPDNNRFKCFACGVSGDAIELVKRVGEVDFRKAVDWLWGGSFGARPEGTARVPGKSRDPDDRVKEVYCHLFELTFPIETQTPAWPYLLGRGFDPAFVNQFLVKQSDTSGGLWQTLLGEFGVDRLRAAGLATKFDAFLFAHHELLFFYLDNKIPVFVQARDVTGRSKAKELCPKGLHSPVPYNVDLLRTDLETVLICEGCIDTLSALQMGYPAVGIPGVAAFRKEWFEFFRHVSHANIVFDNDNAGRPAAWELRSQFRMSGISADVWFPGDGDMNDLLLKLKGV